MSGENTLDLIRDLKPKGREYVKPFFLRLSVPEHDALMTICQRLNLGRQGRATLIRRLISIGIARIEADLDKSGL